MAIVLKYLGSPTSESWPELATLPDYNKITFPYNKGTTWESIIQDAQPEAIDLIRQILIYNSSKRLTADQVMYDNLLYYLSYCEQNERLFLSIKARFITYYSLIYHAGIMSRILLFKTLSLTEEFDKTTAGSPSARKTERNQSERSSEYALRESSKHHLTYTSQYINGMYID